MHRSYKDITDVAGEPLWWDDHGVPRYCEFAINELGVYIKVAVFAEIQCQDCAQRFNVGVGWSPYDFLPDPLDIPMLFPFRYGDPPNHGCIGDTMGTETLAVMGAWKQNKDFAWEAMPQYTFKRAQRII
jgi:hypothetical protein